MKTWKTVEPCDNAASPLSQGRLSWDLVVQTYESVLDAKTAIYCSGPITTGRRAFDWGAQRGMQNVDVDSMTETEKKEFQMEVVELNRQFLFAASKQLREKRGQIVINPAALPHCSDWSQEQWRSLWKLVIERFVVSIVLLEGWMYSKGAIYEVATGLRLGLKIATFEEQIVDAKKAAKAIGVATDELRSRGMNVSFHQQVLKAIADLAAG